MVGAVGAEKQVKGKQAIRWVGGYPLSREA